AFERGRDEGTGRKLAAAREQSPGSAGLTRETLDQVFRRYPEEARRRAAPLRERLAAASAQQARRLAELEPLLDQGDPARGRSIFFGQKSACKTCHTVRAD